MGLARSCVSVLVIWPGLRRVCHGRRARARAGVTRSRPLPWMRRDGKRRAAAVPWQNGDATDCKSVNPGSIPGGTSKPAFAAAADVRSRRLFPTRSPAFIGPCHSSRPFPNRFRSRRLCGFWTMQPGARGVAPWPRRRSAGANLRRRWNAPAYRSSGPHLASNSHSDPWATCEPGKAAATTNQAHLWPASRPALNRQKFFGPFFQKRTACFLFPYTVRRATAPRTAKKSPAPRLRTASRRARSRRASTAGKAAAMMSRRHRAGEPSKPSPT